jgi:hypothetical protein
MYDLDTILSCAVIILILLWIPAFIYALVQKFRGRQPLPYETDEEEEVAASLPTPRWCYFILVPLFIVMLPAFLLMGIVVGPPVMLAEFLWRLGARVKAGLLQRVAHKP